MVERRTRRLIVLVLVAGAILVVVAPALTQDNISTAQAGDSALEPIAAPIELALVGDGSGLSSDQPPSQPLALLPEMSIAETATDLVPLDVVVGTSASPVVQVQAPGQNPPPIPRPPKPKYPKLDSQLSEVAEAAQQGRNRSPEFGLLTHPNAQSSVGVSIYFEPDVPGLAGRLAQLPGVLVANQAQGVIEAYIPVQLLAALDGYPEILRVSPIVPPQPLVTSQGTTAHNSPNWNSFGFTGAGVKVGIIDVGFIGYSSLIGTELPAPVAVRCYTAVGVFSSNIADCQTGDVHGTAVAEAVVDVAPGVGIYIANPASALDLLATTQWMVSQGVQVINHSVSWTWDGAGDGTSPNPNSPLSAVDAGVSGGAVWVNSAGNHATSTWSGPFIDADANDLMEFSVGNELNPVFLLAGEQLTVQVRWQDTWGAADRDLDLLIFNGSLDLVAFSADSQSGIAGDIPLERSSYLAPTTGTYYVAIGYFAGSLPAWVDVQAFSQQALGFYVLSHSIANPAETSNSGALAVGAAWWGDTSTIEPYSSLGPTNDGRTKPDIVGADCAASATSATFCGTSQAAPHVAGLAAIVRQAYPGHTPAQVAGQLKSWALPRGAPVPNNTWGSGFAWLQTIEGKAVFTQAPNEGTAGTAFPVQPIVAMKDASNITLTGDNATVVTLSLLNAGGATLDCTGGLSKTVVSGVATFSGCEVNNAGNGYQLLATPSCFCVITSSASFDVATGATKLGFTQQPAEGVSGTAFPTQPVVAVQDANGTTVTSDSSTQITLSLSSGPGTLTCTGGLTTTAASGLATFSGCSVDAPGTYTLHATSNPALTATDGASFVITGPPTRLAFTKQPGDGLTGTALPTQPTVAVQDSDSATVTSDNTTQVTLALTGPGGGTLTCTGGLTKTVVNGVAAFSGCSVDVANVDYVLHATSNPVLTAADSDQFTVTGLAAKLAFTQQPSNGQTGVALPTQPVVSVQDGAGLTVVTDNSTVVTLSLNGVGTLTCDGGLSKTVSNGIATFSGCAVDAAGTFTIGASSSPALTPADSASFDITASSGTIWYFAEGFTGNGWETYLYLLNATTAPANVSVTYFRASGPPVVKNIIIPGESRRTLFANNPAEGPGDDEAFGITIASDQPITAQQSLIDTAGQLAHGSVGSQVLSQTWYFAEGFTGNAWLTFISATNPGNTTANVTLTYHKTDGTSVVRNASVGPQSRFTFAGHEDPDVPNSTGVGPGHAFSVSISSDQPIVAQEVLIDTVGLLAHGTIGVTSPGTTWYFAEGFTGDFWLTFISVGNLNAGPAEVTATYNILGQAPISRTLTVDAGSRGTFAGHELPTGVGPGQAFGVTITSDIPVVVQEVLIDPKPGVALAHAVMGSPALNTAFTFGGGTSEAGWLTFVSATNPGTSAVTVSATYYFEGGFAPITRTANLAANSRTTFASFDVLTGAPAGRRYGVRVTASAPIISQEVVLDVVRYLAYPAAGTAGP